MGWYCVTAVIKNFPAEGDEVEISNRNQNSPSNDMPRRRLPNITETTEDEAGLNKTKNQNLGSNVIKFRPFGILEPQSARIARKNIKSVILLKFKTIKNHLRLSHYCVMLQIFDIKFSHLTRK